MVICTRHQTPEDRGRIAAHQVTYMRLRTKRYRRLRTELFDAWFHRFMGDEDTDSDEDEAFQAISHGDQVHEQGFHCHRVHRVWYPVELSVQPCGVSCSTQFLLGNG